VDGWLCRVRSRATFQAPLIRLNGRPSIVVFEAAKEIGASDDPDTLRSVIKILRTGKRVLNRVAAAYCLNLMRSKPAIRALEESVSNRQEHPKVRGQAAESLAHNHRKKSHRLLLQHLNDSSREIRFWSIYALAEMGDSDALPLLRDIAKRDQRIVKGFWSISREAKWAIRRIQNEVRGHIKKRPRRCLYCSKAWKLV
jgi:HEAT repeat protein